MFLAPYLVFGFSVFGVIQSCPFSYSKAEFPWIVRILVQKTHAQLCVGNMLSEGYIMSPVSCYRRWSTLPKDYYSAKHLMVIAGRDDEGKTFCSQERPGVVVTAHSNFSKDSHANNIAILEVDVFDIVHDDPPVMPFIDNEEQNVAAMLKIQKDKARCFVPTFKPTKYLRNIIEDKDSMVVEMVDGDECWKRFCPRGHKACLSFFDVKHYVCAQFVKPEKRCGREDVGAPLVCDKVVLGYMKICRDNRPMVFQGFNSNILHSMNRYTNMSIVIRKMIRMAEIKKKEKRKY